MNGPDLREIESQRLRSALRAAFDRAPELQPTAEFTNRLRDELRQASRRPRASALSARWLAAAAGFVLVVGATAATFLVGRADPSDLMAQDAIGDHRNCALKYRLHRMPVPLEEAAQRFDSGYRLLMSAPPDDIVTPDGNARVIERHSCAFGERRFGHVILEYRGRVVSLLVTRNDEAVTAGEFAGADPHVIGQSNYGLSVVSVRGTRHAVLLVGDLDKKELTKLAGIVSTPLVQQLGSVLADRHQPVARAADWEFKGR